MRLGRHLPPLPAGGSCDFVPAASCPPLVFHAHAVATAGGASTLYPAAATATIDTWLELAQRLEAAAAAWLPPTCTAATPQQRQAAQQEVEAALQQLETQLGRSGAGAYLVGDGVTLADVGGVTPLPPGRCLLCGCLAALLGYALRARCNYVPKLGARSLRAVLCSLLALYQGVLGQAVQAAHPGVAAWVQRTAAEPNFAAVLGKSAAGSTRWCWCCW